ncbi:hypothetical protein B4U79_16818 [Dinothrombium tinctorium]|uniref:Lipase domain-containing protein n=1 Tax=Dinothrombium tinctorium TaxID=1965070 RepID=A0A3S3RJW9_9ACAR|nr:hypothetical protein B4U79_16818 [Dinothrombium tinctorium]
MPVDMFSDIIQLYSEKFKNVNVIVINWTEGAVDFYAASVANVVTVAHQTAQLVKKLSEKRGMKPDYVRFIGFSL